MNITLLVGLTVLTYIVKTVTVEAVQASHPRINQVVDILSWVYAIFVCLQGIPFTVMYFAVTIWVGRDHLKTMRIKEMIEGE